jgi:hypothetical protein
MSAGVRPSSRYFEIARASSRLASRLPCFVPDQAVVVVDRRRQAEEVLEDDLHRGEVEKILAPDHVGDALVGIVEGGGEEVGDDILALAGQDDVADLA